MLISPCYSIQNMHYNTVPKCLSISTFFKLILPKVCLTVPGNLCAYYSSMILNSILKAFLLST